MSKLSLSMGVGTYDHVRDLACGTVPIQGATITPVFGTIEDLLYRTHNHAECDVAELGMGGYVSRLARGEQPYVAIPVFTSRMMRHSCVYINEKSGIKSPHDLNGKKIGMPEWGMAAAIWVRGMLTEEYGLDQKSVQWVQSGLYQPGRVDRSAPQSSLGIPYTSRKDKSLNDMLLSGEIDALFSARAPEAFTLPNTPIRRLFDNCDQVESEYWQRTSILPVMHMIGIRKNIYEQHRWIAQELLRGFEKSKNLSLERARDVTGSFFPIPLMLGCVERAVAIGGEDFWPYGVDKNFKTLDTFLRYADEQGVTQRRLTVEELFAPETQFATKT